MGSCPGNLSNPLCTSLCAADSTRSLCSQDVLPLPDLQEGTTHSSGPSPHGVQGSSEEDIRDTVIKAKKEMAEFSHTGRFLEYKRICEILASADPLASLLQEMEKKGLVVKNIPPVLPAPSSLRHSSSRAAESLPAPSSLRHSSLRGAESLPGPSLVGHSSSRGAESLPGPSLVGHGSSRGAESLPGPSLVGHSSSRGAESNSEQEAASDTGYEEYYQSTGGPKWTTDVQVEMAKKGLYKKHSIDHPLLRGFFHYLLVDLGNRRSKQEVETVSRFMYYMDPKEPSLSFVREVEKVREYFNVLSQTQLSKQTVLNYWKSLKRFMKYTITSTSLQIKDKGLFDYCRNFIHPLDGIRAGMSKKINKELTPKRYHSYGKEKLPADCVAILDVALGDFLAVMGKLQGPDAISGEELDKDECLLVLYYLEAVIMLKLLQRPSVVSNMTVEEWQGRKHTENGCCVAVKEHKTAAS
ncbi:hypothetical protein F2P79_025420 [Pimephales promelas]|nr:hypothetical protein F2P79_025420 [Pimephales promelas]